MGDKWEFTVGQDFFFIKDFRLPGEGQNRLKAVLDSELLRAKTSGNHFGLRYNRTKHEPCFAIPRMERQWLRPLFPAAPSGRYHFPLAPLPLKRSKFQKFSLHRRRLGGAGCGPTGTGALCAPKLRRQRRFHYDAISLQFHRRMRRARGKRYHEIVKTL